METISGAWVRATFKVDSVITVYPRIMNALMENVAPRGVYLGTGLTFFVKYFLVLPDERR